MRDSQAMIASEVDHGTSIQDLQNLGRIMLEVKGTVEGLQIYDADARIWNNLSMFMDK